MKEGERKVKEEVERKEKEMEGEVVRKIEKEVSMKVGEVEKRVKEEVTKKEEERRAVQEELDDLLIVFADIEEKAKNYKVCFIFKRGGSGLCARGLTSCVCDVGSIEGIG